MPRSRRTRPGVASACPRRRSSRPRTSCLSKSQTCACGGSTPVTCAPRCTRRRSPARTSPIGRCRDGSSCIPAASRGATAERPAPARRPAPTGRNERVITTFVLPPELEAFEPAEVRGRGRDDVRLLVGRRSTNEVEHRHFRELPSLLQTRRRPRRQHVNDPPRRRRRRPRRRATRRPLLQPTSGRHLDRRGARLSLAAPRPPRRRAGQDSSYLVVQRHCWRRSPPTGSGSRVPTATFSGTWRGSAGPSGTGTSRTTGRCPPTARSLGPTPAARRCPAPAVPSREPSWID